MTVSVEKITKRFTLKGTPAVFEATFEAAPGGITTLLGPSGSGKTTLLRVIAGLETTDEGRILIDGKDLAGVPVRKRGLGFVFQTFALFNHLTVRENVAFGLEVRKLTKPQITRRVDELLALVGLEGLGHRYPVQLSGGQRQRVGFARALAPHPSVLLLDEPFGALDARVRTELRAWLRDLHRTVPVTTLLVTHDQEEALELSDRIVVMDRGRVHQVGSPREVYDDPSTAFVASFVGTANVLSAQVEGGRAAVGPVWVPAPGAIPDGSNVQMIVRPHDVRVSRADGVPSPYRSVGRIRHVARLGSFVKLDLMIPSGDVVTVHVPRTAFEEMKVDLGDPVLVDLASARIFVEDLAI